MNRRAQAGVDPFQATFVLLLISAVALSATVVLTQDLSLLWEARPEALGWFGLAGGVHFFLGWTFLGLSQRLMGAARTGIVAGSTPIFGTAFAFAILDEVVGVIALGGVVLVVAGVLVLSVARVRDAGGPRGISRGGLVLGFLTAICWGLSPVFIRWGLADLPAPLVGVTVAMTVATTAYGLALALRGRRSSHASVTGGALRWLLVGGGLVAFAIAAQWTALALVPVAVVVALNQLAVPVVLLAAPLVVGGDAEAPTLRTAAGGALVLAGTLLAIFSRAGPPA